MLTCVTCIGFVGVEIVGRREELVMPVNMPENIFFFFLPPLDSDPVSSEYLCLGLLVPS